MPSGYTSTVTTESSKPMLGSPSTGGNGSPSGPIFPGAATAAGPQGQAGRTTLVGPRTTASSGTAAPPSAGAAPSGTSPVTTPTSGAPDGAQAQPADSVTLGYIRVEYDGPRTLVMIDELPRGRTPFVGRASPGAHSVRLIGSKARFPIQQVRVAIGDTALASFSELAPAP